MSLIHRTTLTPTKLELLTEWLPRQPWYAGAGRPELSKAGGFRLDDPLGAVGVEFMVVTDQDGAAYHVPMAYRDAPLSGAEDALIGTAQHGVLGRRWIYDGAHDPVVVTQLVALMRGEAEAQAQSVSDTPDPTVGRHYAGPVDAAVSGAGSVTGGPEATTDVSVDAGPAGRLVLRVARALRPDSAGSATEEALGHVAAGWRQPDGSNARAVFAILRKAAAG
ncbi:maltokinase N-terminal cap-like domain-containing protein [Actinacidiphila sp. bgisy167]|uniref:maltokinase N-terminal cap-like domain-containing protein n=1 Tax=Actinacidiphila sp. bgisy167 TaxID=3413797 RepID=UPI003D7128BC